MKKSAAAQKRWDAENPTVHVPGDPDCDCYAYTPEFRKRHEEATEDSRSERVFRASPDDFDALMDGRMTVHDFSLREALVAFESAAPRHTGLNF